MLLKSFLIWNYIINEEYIIYIEQAICGVSLEVSEFSII